MDSISKINYAKIVDEINEKISSGEIAIIEAYSESYGAGDEDKPISMYMDNQLDFSALIAKGAMLHELTGKIDSGELCVYDPISIDVGFDS